MGTTGKQGMTKPPQAAVRKDGVPVNVTPLRDDTLAATQAFIKQKVHEKRSYVKAAFANPYNLSLLAGGLVASALTLNPLLAIITVGLEVLWPEAVLLVIFAVTIVGFSASRFQERLE